MRYILLVVVFFLLNVSCKQEQKQREANVFSSFSRNDTAQMFSWSQVCCDYKGIYNPQKYSNEQLVDTHKLVFGIRLENDDVAFEPRDLNKLDIDKWKNDFDVKRNLIRDLNLVPGKYWDDLKRLRMREMEEQYELGNITIKAYFDSTALLNNRFTEHCIGYVTALTSEDSSALLDGWAKYINQHKLQTGDSVDYLKKYREEYNSPNKRIIAKLTLITLGWHNCANDIVYHVKEDGSFELEFEKLFTVVQPDCDGCD